MVVLLRSSLKLHDLATVDVDQPVQFLLALADQRCNLAAECRNVGSLAVSRYAKDAANVFDATEIDATNRRVW